METKLLTMKSIAIGSNITLGGRTFTYLDVEKYNYVSIHYDPSLQIFILTDTKNDDMKLVHPSNIKDSTPTKATREYYETLIGVKKDETPPTLAKGRSRTAGTESSKQA